MATVLRLPAVRVTCAGRTDAGVHARGQVCHADIPTEAYDGAGGGLVARLAGLLPADLRVRDVRKAPPGFDARFSAQSRSYAYRIADSACGPDPLRRRDVLWHRHPLDTAAMGRAAQGLLGEHDFAAFCRARAGATTVRALLRLGWTRSGAAAGDTGVVVGEVEADAFCHSMVRALVGALLAVGDGRREENWPVQVLAGRARVPDVHVAAAHGLTLEAVRYPPDAELGVRAEQTRRVREPAS